MDDNTLAAIVRLIELAEHLEDSSNSSTNDGRDQVLETIDLVFRKLEFKPVEVTSGGQ